MLYPKKVEQLRNFTFVIIDDNQINALKTKAVAESFQTMHCLAIAHSYEDGLDMVLENRPEILFLEIDPQDKESKLSLLLINELHRYLTVIPKIIITTSNDTLCLEALKYGVFDYFITPIEAREFRKTLYRLEKELGNQSISIAIPASNVVTPVKNSIERTEQPIVTLDSEAKVILPAIDVLEEALSENEAVSDENKLEEPKEDFANDANEVVLETKKSESVSYIKTDNAVIKPLVICVKSYGDYRYIDAKDICYLQADNNSTDIHLNTGEMITAFKTLKHFEGVLTNPFVRIHNSYIVNTDYISRIHTGNAVCHIKNTTTKLPFSKSYKENIDIIITTIASGNYLEI